MYPKKPKLSNKNKLLYTIITLVVIIALTISLNPNREPNFIENILKKVPTLVNKTITMPFTKAVSKNEQNQDENYLIQKNLNAALNQEISELKSLLELNKTLTEYEVENATTLSRNKSYWFNTITIDKGKKDGIKNDMAVITSNGLIGKINKVYSNSSEVKLITSNDANYKISVSIRINGVDNYAILNGYDQEKNLLKVTGVSKTISINKGDAVLTSGLGELFPAGIFIGEVSEIENDKYDLSKNVYIKTNQDFNSIHYVSVLKEKK